MTLKCKELSSRTLGVFVSWGGKGPVPRACDVVSQAGWAWVSEALALTRRPLLSPSSSVSSPVVWAYGLLVTWLWEDLKRLGNLISVGSQGHYHHIGANACVRKMPKSWLFLPMRSATYTLFCASPSPAPPRWTPVSHQ